MKKYILLGLVFFIELVCYSQISFNMNGKQYIVNGQLVCSYTDKTLDHHKEVDCWVDASTDTLVYCELRMYSDGVEYLMFWRYKVAIKDLALDKTNIFDTDVLEKDKKLFNLHLYTHNFEEKTITEMFNKYGNYTKTIGGMLTIVCNTKETATAILNQLKGK
jgi:hypothetical protein